MTDVFRCCILIAKLFLKNLICRGIFDNVCGIVYWFWINSWCRLLRISELCWFWMGYVCSSWTTCIIWDWRWCRIWKFKMFLCRFRLTFSALRLWFRMFWRKEKRFKGIRSSPIILCLLLIFLRAMCARNLLLLFLLIYAH